MEESAGYRGNVERNFQSAFGVAAVANFSKGSQVSPEGQEGSSTPYFHDPWACTAGAKGWLSSTPECSKRGMLKKNSRIDVSTQLGKHSGFKLRAALSLHFSSKLESRDLISARAETRLTSDSTLHISPRHVAYIPIGSSNSANWPCFPGSGRNSFSREEHHPSLSKGEEN